MNLREAHYDGNFTVSEGKTYNTAVIYRAALGNGGYVLVFVATGDLTQRMGTFDTYEDAVTYAQSLHADGST